MIQKIDSLAHFFSKNVYKSCSTQCLLSFTTWTFALPFILSWLQLLNTPTHVIRSILGNTLLEGRETTHQQFHLWKGKGEIMIMHKRSEGRGKLTLSKIHACTQNIQACCAQNCMNPVVFKKFLQVVYSTYMYTCTCTVGPFDKKINHGAIPLSIYFNMTNLLKMNWWESSKNQISVDLCVLDSHESTLWIRFSML